MTTMERTAADKRALRIFRVLLVFALVGALGASISGISLWIVDPAAGSTAEAALGITAAISGLTTGILLGAAAIYAQVKNLWRFAPDWVRYVAWAVLLSLALLGPVMAVFNSGS